MNLINMEMKNLDFSSIIREIQKIPKWLRIVLLFVCAFGGSYWLFSRNESSVTTKELLEINRDILRINQRLNQTVEFSDYVKDFNNLNHKMELLQEVFNYSAEMRLVQLDYLMNLHDYTPSKMAELEALKERYKKMVNIYNTNFNALPDESYVLKSHRGDNDENNKDDSVTASKKK